MLRRTVIAAAVSLVSFPSFVSAQETALEEVLVTATKRAGVSAQDVPISITVIDQEALEQADIEGLTDLTRLSASLVAVQAQSVAATRLGLRGLSTSTNNVGFEAAVGVSIDGVVRSRTGIALSELPELASVEILRGPQGTLFGRNTTAGIVNINTARPDPEGGGFVSAQVGNYDALTLQGAINIPINDEWTGRIDGKIRERDGYLEEVNTGSEINSLDRSMIRGQLTFNGEKSSLRLIADWAEDQSECCGAVFWEQNFNNPVFTALAARDGRVPYGSSEPDDLETAFSRRPTNDISEWGFSAEYSLDLGDKQFTSITSYRDWESDVDADGDTSAADLVVRDTFSANRVFTQELRLQGQAGALDWMVGGFYIHDEVEWVSTINPNDFYNNYVDLILAGFAGIQGFGTLPSVPGQPGFTPSILSAINPQLATTFFPDSPFATDDFEQTTDAIAIFTHNEIQLSESLTATLGLRYTDETKELDYVFSSGDSGSPLESCRVAQGLAGSPLAAFTPLLCAPVVNILFDGSDKDDISYDAFSGTAKLAWSVNDDALFYASYSRGFKSGGFNLDRTTITLNDGGGSIEDLSFDEEIVDAYELGWNSTFVDGKVTFNGAVYLQEVTDFQQIIFNGLNFNVAQGDLESKGIELDLTANPIAPLTINANYAYTDAEEEDGLPPQAQPENVFSLAGTLILPLSSNLVSAFHLNARYQDEIRLFGDEYQDGYTTINGRISIRPKSGSWEVAIWGQNLSDENQLIGGFPATLNTAGGNLQGFPTVPRMYGAELRYSF